ncbi:FtsX-like permease family protein [Nocardioides panzhihuensis]|uniref:Putative ABC transport system permease protein n=1 Tax=Nocardioides panzhihuensis TaxID=860243 RepID=A0A7Z0IQY9_9ACTN|nr:ABC transporter permease [Nocardioides panzhihuensis]NYI76444.1 putative ABC transport system permease protein [Nocardioides panzhihuensis]
MFSLALRSLRHRATAMTATFVAILLGTAVMGSFTPLIQVALEPGTPAAEQETLLVLGGVVGAWGTVIALFSIVSTVGVTVRQREVEIGLLRTVGAEPRQVRTLVRAETLVVALVAATLGALVASLTSRALLDLLQSGGVVGEQVSHSGGWVALAATVVLLLLVSLAAAGMAGSRASRGPATVAPAEGRAGSGRIAWWRWAVALVAVGQTATMVAMTMATGKDAANPYDAMAMTGSLGLLLAVGLAALAPLLLRAGSWLLRPLLVGTSGHLAAYNTSRRSHLLAGVLAPVMVLSAAAVSILMLVGIDERTMPVGLSPEIAEEFETINLLNNVVTAMICAFAAIMVVNAFAAVLADRRLELRRLMLLGATPGQVRGSVLAEAGIVAAVGNFVGLIAAQATIVPFAFVRGEGLLPDEQLWLPPLLLGGAVALTLASAVGATSRALRTTSGTR